ncbi:MAG: right-handed parallel beta-helix repeat-containing protein, partial [Phycisphaerae bacterium]
FNGNSAYYGGGMCNSESAPRLTNCTFSRNLAGRDGAGMYNYWYSDPMLTSSTFTGNHADAFGGGMFNDDSSPALTNCTFSGNSAEHAGGMHNLYSDPTLINCTFGRNSAEHGGGMHNYNSSPTLGNCTFSENSAPKGPALGFDSYEQSYPSTVQMTNCILWDGGNEIWNNDGSTITITYSDVQDDEPDDGIVYPGIGNIDEDPRFVPGPGGCYYLSQVVAGDAVNSPCVDSGSDTASSLGLDTMTTRSDEGIDMGIVDMGCHYPVTGQPFIMGDFDRSGRIDLRDFAGLQSCFTGSPDDEPVTVSPCCRIFDFKPPDGDVDLDDYAAFQSALTGP